MEVGCRHNPDAVCDDCARDMANGGGAIFIETELKPEPNESLEHFQERVRIEREATGGKSGKSKWVEPSLEEQKRLIKDPSTPEPVRRYWREKLYGKGGTGRKDIRQDNLQKRGTALVDNHSIRTMKALTKQAGTALPHTRPKDMSGRQWKRAKRLLRGMAKVVKQAA